MLEDKGCPAQLSIKYNNKSNRATVFLRLLLALPILTILILLLEAHLAQSNNANTNVMQIGGGFLFFPIMLMIVFRQKYPKWWFDWICELVKFSCRIAAYMMMLTDNYPSTDEEQDVKISLKYPNVKEDLNRYLPLIKWLLAMPHFLMLSVLGVAVLLLLPIVWLIILMIGRMPKKLFNFLVGLMRYSLRVSAYSVLLITDKYPSFSWKE
ncbi:hypothetical protein AZO1586I_2285 [Bathymodiolus thermophilus thioautotrophic gill symbiont]|jgi:hypothetical protein|uniref:Uncharacterized protein n=3 Tax=sulfur-oxidizing symbionts TaxID=32036 RepID=A0ACA8ZR29_9GAMM|nr:MULTISPECIES: DUF4389 domain-containing protein [sulfur-oxidizing symbionts]CAC5834956.1 POSSIBLE TRANSMEMBRANE PROTEIN [uncultured Gammaproteobacteria bacterium]CAB5503390.1 hypothetical protein AZO1586R_1582 [Bathymodiolus azoricus thioautotrophic gill symbiont]CAB5508010.1 hypothetical protein AZO1586I_2285 [Bathymodiolus thermophilus thioautotrophic gill symbiont]CAC9496979.1 POSSIBLE TRANSMEMBRANE PROTEIN [uncultured Gammaproteobacteria bacterium]CAC9516608.1 POSSIBLE TRANSMEMBRANE PRO